MHQILSWARQTEAKHSLFLFDSCFSGTVFKTRAGAVQPRHITSATSLPVRQFITAGSAGEQVPAQSTFTPAFVDALVYGYGDLNKDGYVSGTELGLYLQQEVPRHVNQTPQFGKIQDYELSRGDFIFVLPQTNTGSLTPTTIPTTTSLTVQSNVRGDRIYIDGKYKGSTRLDLEIPKGRHTVRIEKEGYKTYEEEIDIKNALTLRASLEKIAKGVSVTVMVTDTLQDGKPVEPRSTNFGCASQIFTAVYLTDLAEGAHTLVIDWIDPSGRLRERNIQKVGYSVREIVTWLKLNPAAGSGMLRAFNPAIGMSSFIGIWTVMVSVDDAAAVQKTFHIIC